MPIAVGENLHTVYRFDDFLRAGAAQIVQPNVVRVGGITPFLGIAAIAAEHGAAAAPAPAARALRPARAQPAPSPGVAEPMVEDVEDAGFGALGALDAPVARHDRRRQPDRDPARRARHPLR